MDAAASHHFSFQVIVVILVSFLVSSSFGRAQHDSSPSLPESVRRYPRSQSTSYTGGSGHHQKIDNNKSSGQYRVPLPDGRLQIVTYTADDSGYHAEVAYEGTPRYPPHQQHHQPAYSHPPVTYHTTPASYEPRSYKQPATYKPRSYKQPATYTPRSYKPPATYKLRTYKEKSPTSKPIYTTTSVYHTTPATYKPRSYKQPATYKPRSYKSKPIYTTTPVYTTTAPNKNIYSPNANKPTPKPYHPPVTIKTTPASTTTSPYHPAPVPYKQPERYTHQPYSPTSYNPDPYTPVHETYQPHSPGYSHGPNPSRYGSRLSSSLYRSPFRPSLAPYKPLFVKRS